MQRYVFFEFVLQYDVENMSTSDNEPCFYPFLFLFIHFGDTQEAEILVSSYFDITRRNIEKLFFCWKAFTKKLIFGLFFCSLRPLFGRGSLDQTSSLSILKGFVLAQNTKGILGPKLFTKLGLHTIHTNI